MATAFEREFLVRLAAIWLACRWRVMGGVLYGEWPPPSLANDLLGMIDYQNEMSLLCKEQRDRIQ